MDFFEDEHADAQVRYLSRQEVVRACRDLDAVEVTAEALRQHAAGNAILPPEAYLGWQDSTGHTARCLAMPGGLHYPDRTALGLKVINSSLGNPARGIPRSQGFTMVFDPETARPQMIMEAAYISAVRTAAVTVVTALAVAGHATSCGLIGCGTLAKAHLVLLAGRLTGLAEFWLYDRDRAIALRLAEQCAATALRHGLKIRVAASAEECVRNSDLVIPATTVTEGYLPLAWLRPGALVAHISLDDLTPAVITECDLLLVDDWHLVRDDSRRLLGRMWRDGSLLAPGGDPNPDVAPRPPARAVDASIGEVLIGAHPGRAAEGDIIVSNPFGMSILDVALADRVREAAGRLGLGRDLPV
ncbi:ornithine cyclodeaminase family protein [Frankia sp. Ag45/Mut15]|uniref:Ornithine cyclodeaminase family protein n=1 Tax=Frankia umida TaxID=573489 RepID=A0ABT0K3H4_9ACTN|nr:ornithine cyclodeaminase family protein [Frankia umida]MCK9877833.1 ornithine cyclodeaminase family protein [Frankia umida]